MTKRDKRIKKYLKSKSPYAIRHFLTLPDCTQDFVMDNYFKSRQAIGCGMFLLAMIGLALGGVLYFTFGGGV